MRVSKNDQAALDAGYYFDESKAERVQRFFRQFIRHTNGDWAGKPFELLDWQYRDIIRPLFGWVNPAGRRRYRKAYISTAKKNGKTTFIAALGIYLLVADGESGAEVYSAAASRDQASMIFREAAKMIRLSPELSRIIHVIDSNKRLVGPHGSLYRALSADAHTNEGPNASAILFDELHAQPGRELWDTLRYAGSARAQPLMIAITTAGGDLQTICGEQYQLAKSVIEDRHVDHTMFAYIAEANVGDDWTLEETWKKANPGYGINIDPQVFRSDFLEARESPAKENSFRRYRLNQWVQTADAWLSMDQWDACGADYTADSLKGKRCFAGLDLSSTDDTTALVLVFPIEGGGVKTLSWFWLPKDNIEVLERKHKVPYRTWAKQGFFNLTPGNVVDYRVVRSDINAIAERYNIAELVIDRKFQGQQVETELQEDGFTVYAAGQGWVSQDLPAKELERLLKCARFCHDKNPVLRWHASNVVVDIDKNGNYSINKRRSRSKIDGIAALINAMGPTIRAVAKTSVYETRGVRRL